jgi:site-specific DNA-methyltransferase (adenine-specific)
MEMDLVIEGDSLNVMAGMPPASVDLVLTDPPYGKTALDWDVVPVLGDLWRLLFRVGKPSCSFVFTCVQPFTTDLVNSARKFFRHDWVWVKNAPSGMMLAGKAPMRRHETIVVFCRKSPKFNPQKVMGSLTSQNHSKKGYSYCNKASKLYSVDGGVPFVWSAEVNPHSVLPCDVVGNRDKNKVHPTQKPVALFEYLVRTYSDPGDLVLDPFAGSGTTAMACKTTGRRYVCVEREHEHVENARLRLASLSLRVVGKSTNGEEAGGLFEQGG